MGDFICFKQRLALICTPAAFVFRAYCAQITPSLHLSAVSELLDQVCVREYQGMGILQEGCVPSPPPISWTESCFTWCLLISQPKQTAPHTTEHGHQFPCNINSLKSPIQTKNQSWWLLSWVFPVASFPPKYVIQNKLHNQKLHTSWLVLPNSSTLQLSSFSPKLFTDWRTYSSTVTAYCSGHIYLKELGALILWTNHNSVKVVIQSTVCRPYISGIMWRKNCVDWEYLCILILIIFHFCLFNGTYFSV